MVSDIQNGSNGSYSSIITKIRSTSMFNCIFTFEGRAANSDDDRLAKFSNYLDQGRHVWMVHPHDPFVIPLHVDFE